MLEGPNRAKEVYGPEFKVLLQTGCKKLLLDV